MGKKRGFALLHPTKLKEVSSKGGKTATKLGKAHQYKAGSALAIESGRKGGQANAAKVKAAKKAPTNPAPVSKPVSADDDLDNDDMSLCGGPGGCGGA
jgi:general stress protein YciG